MRLAPAIAMASCLPSALMAGQGGVFGLWCNDSGDLMQIDESGLRGSEHVNCDWVGTVGDGPEIVERLHCRTQKQVNGAWVTIHKEIYNFSGKLTDTDHLNVVYADGRFAYTMTRCDD